MRHAHVSDRDAEEFVIDAAIRLISYRIVARNPQALLMTAALRLFLKHKSMADRVIVVPMKVRDCDDEYSTVYHAVESRSSSPDVVSELGEKDERVYDQARVRTALAELKHAERILLER